MSIAGDSYPPPPWHHRNVLRLTVLCRAQNPAALHRWIQPPLRPIPNDPDFAVFFIHIPTIDECGEAYESHECGLLVPVLDPTGDGIGATIAFMIVDNDVALCGGREIWGYPKKLGHVTIDAETTTRVVCRTSNMRYRDAAEREIFSVEATLDGTHSGVSQSLERFGPRFIRKSVPSAYGPYLQSDELIRVSITDVVIRSETTGRAGVILGDSPELLSDAGPITVLGAVGRVSDYTLQYGLTVQTAGRDPLRA